MSYHFDAGARRQPLGAVPVPTKAVEDCVQAAGVSYDKFKNIDFAHLSLDTLAALGPAGEQIVKCVLEAGAAAGCGAVVGALTGGTGAAPAGWVCSEVVGAIIGPLFDALGEAIDFFFGKSAERKNWEQYDAEQASLSKAEEDFLRLVVPGYPGRLLDPPWVKAYGKMRELQKHYKLKGYKLDEVSALNQYQKYLNATYKVGFVEVKKSAGGYTRDMMRPPDWEGAYLSHKRALCLHCYDKTRQAAIKYDIDLMKDVLKRWAKFQTRVTTATIKEAVRYAQLAAVLEGQAFAKSLAKVANIKLTGGGGVKEPLKLDFKACPKGQAYDRAGKCVSLDRDAEAKAAKAAKVAKAKRRADVKAAEAKAARKRAEATRKAADIDAAHKAAKAAASAMREATKVEAGAGIPWGKVALGVGVVGVAAWAWRRRAA